MKQVDIAKHISVYIYIHIYIYLYIYLNPSRCLTVCVTLRSLLIKPTGGNFRLEGSFEVEDGQKDELS